MRSFKLENLELVKIFIRNGTAYNGTIFSFGISFLLNNKKKMYCILLSPDSDGYKIHEFDRFNLRVLNNRITLVQNGLTYRSDFYTKSKSIEFKVLRKTFFSREDAVNFAETIQHLV